MHRLSSTSAAFPHFLLYSRHACHTCRRSRMPTRELAGAHHHLQPGGPRLPPGSGATAEGQVLPGLLSAASPDSHGEPHAGCKKSRLLPMRRLPPERRLRSAGREGRRRQTDRPTPEQGQPERGGANAGLSRPRRPLPPRRPPRSAPLRSPGGPLRAAARPPACAPLRPRRALRLRGAGLAPWPGRGEGVSPCGVHPASAGVRGAGGSEETPPCGRSRGAGCGARCGCRAGPPASQRCAPEKVLLLHLSAAGKGRNRSGQWQRGVGGGCPPVHLRGGPAGCPSSPEPRFGVRSFGAAPPRGAANALTGPPSPGLGLRAPCAPRPAGSVPALLLPQPRLGRAGLDVSGRPCGAEPRPGFVAEEREE